MENKDTICKNCERSFQEEYDFCPYCGQRSKDDLTIGLLFYNTISNYFSFDARFFKSFIPLMTRPGYIPRRFVEGKRLRFLHPAQFYLFISVIFFFLFSFIARKQQLEFNKSMEKGIESIKIIDTTKINEKFHVVDSTIVNNIQDQINDNEIIKDAMGNEQIKSLDSLITLNVDQEKKPLNFNFTKKLDSLIEIGAPEEEQLKAIGMKDSVSKFNRKIYKQLLKVYKQRGGGVVQAFYDSVPIAMFFLLPIFAFILKIFFYNRGRFSHHLVFSFYYFSFLFTVFSILIGVNFIWDLPAWIDIMVVLSTFFYLFLAIRHFYQQGYILSFIKSSIVSFFYISFVIPLAFVFMVIAALMFF
jgi:hypothetical protein